MTKLLHHTIELLFAYAQRLPILRRRRARFKIHLSRGIVEERHSKEDASKATLDIASVASVS